MAGRCDERARWRRPAGAAAQGTYAGLPYDWRRPSRARARLWNPGDPRVLTPKSFGWGWAINFYWLAHPVRLARGRRAR